MKSKTKENVDFTEMRPDKLAEYIVNTHHAYIKSSMDRFEVQLKTIEKVDKAKYPEMEKVVIKIHALKEIMVQHLNLEDHMLFPYIHGVMTGKRRALGQNIVESPIARLKQEHAKVLQILESLRELSGNYTAPVNASPALKLCYAQLFDFEQDIHKHIFLEEDILFPKLLILEKKI